MNKVLLSLVLLFLIGCAFAQREESSFWGNTEEDIVEEGPVRESSVVKKQVEANNKTLTFCRIKMCKYQCRDPIIDMKLDCVVISCAVEPSKAFQSQCVE